MIPNQERFNQEQLSQEQLFNKINIIGLGLMGGSIAASCKKHKISKIVTGFDANKAVTDFALANNIIDELYDFEEISDNDLTIIAAPLLSYEDIFQKLSLKINKGILVDIGSLKLCVVSWAENILANKAANFIACHPIAGSDRSGVANADADLFDGKKVIITPSEINSQIDIEKVELFWHKIGSSVEFIEARQHDKIFALVSHLPQFLAFIAKEEFKNGDDEILNQHFRLQNSNPKIWQEIFALNRENIEYYLQFYLKNLDEVIGKIENNRLDNFLLDCCVAKAPRNDEVGSLERILETSSLRGAVGDAAIQNVNDVARRLLLVICFLNLPDIEQFKSFAGTGFRDFTAIINYPKSHPNLNPKSLIQFLNQIKSRVTNYEFE